MHPSQTLRDASMDSTVWLRRWPAAAVLVLGFAVLYAAGFSALPEAHNATHDTRHATGFPCH